jgi:NNP family nitrate/nitrite transporter-like MFS transporter
VTYAVFIVMTAALIVLSIPNGSFIAEAHPGAAGPPMIFTYRLGLWLFSSLLFVLGCAMGIGKASVYKYIPDYFPNDVGAVGGIVGMLGALGGFILPPTFGILGRWSGVPQLAFAALLVIALWSLAWLHLAVLRLRTARSLVDGEGHLPAQYTTASPL